MKLSRRQIDIIRCGALGMTDKEIATKLGLATNTVKLHMQRLREKIGNFNRWMMPGMGLILGLVSIADICVPALLFLQDLVPENDRPQRAHIHEGAD